MSMLRTYSELVSIPSFIDRYRYLKLNGKVGEELFGYARYLNQVFYQSGRWKKVRRDIIIRDHGCDLGCGGHEIKGFIYVHHLNPLTLDQVKNDDPCMVDPENLICVSRKTHEAITLGDESLLCLDPIIRRPNDTCPWKKVNSEEFI